MTAKLMVLIIMLGINYSFADSTDYFIRVLTPPNEISTDKNFLYIVGESNAPSVLFYLNGEKVGESKVANSIFHFHLHFGYGLNDLTLVAYNDDSLEIAESKTALEVLYSPTVARKYSKYYPTYTFHKKESREECIGCHNLTGWNIDTIKTSHPCYECHIHKKETFMTHIPNDTLACVNCHHLKGDLSFISGAGFGRENPCNKCHSDEIGEFNAEYIHGPVAGGTCVICHSPHGSANPPTLNAPQETLCVSCHYEIEENLKLQVQHKPFKLGQCGSCHDPHATNNKWVLIKDSEQLCLNCHGESTGLDFHQHPYNVKPKKKLATNLKLADSGRLECLSCHNPHATDTRHLLRVSQEVTCMGCHPDRYDE